MADEKRSKKIHYNPQLGYLETVFDHNYDFLREIANYEVVEGGIELDIVTNGEKNIRAKITLLAQESMRFQMFPDGDDVFENSIIDPESITDKFDVQENKDNVEISNGKLKIVLQKLPWEMSLYYQGKLLCREQIKDSNVDNMQKYLPTGFDLNHDGEIEKVYTRMTIFSDEYFYGFGEKYTGFNKRGQKIINWQEDALCTNSRKSYKNIPFFMSSRGYGILLNTFSKSVFDMGQTSEVAYSMEVEDKYLDYIFIPALNSKGVLQRYTEFTGRSQMPPKWSFGLWVSRCSYRTQEEVESIARQMREHGIPSDVIHIDGWMRKTSGGDWVWDKERFPNPEEMIENLADIGFKLSLWIWPYIPVGCDRYEEAKDKDFLVKDSEGNVVQFLPTATTDRKVAAFDFTNPDLQKWYKKLVQNVVKDGVGAVKTDFSEALPENAVYWDGSNGLQGHNKFTLLYNKTVYEAVKEIKEKQGERPVLWARSGYAGSQNYPVHWAGDSSTHLNNLACILRSGLSIGLSGVSFWAHDIGGFYNTDHEGYEIPPSDEEYIRSAQFGLLSPFSRFHGKTPREPWHFGEKVEEIFTTFDNLRYKLLPYYYSTAYETTQNGIPMIRPMFMEFEDDPTTYNLDLQYMLGESFLIVPVFDQEKIKVYLPIGKWLDYWSGEVIEGGRWLEPEKSLDKIPVFIRENSIIPILGEKEDYISEDHFTSLEAIVTLRNYCKFEYKEDDREGSIEVTVQGNYLDIKTKLPLERIDIYLLEDVDIRKVYFNGIEMECSIFTKRSNRIEINIAK